MLSWTSPSLPIGEPLEGQTPASRILRGSVPRTR